MVKKLLDDDGSSSYYLAFLIGDSYGVGSGRELSINRLVVLNWPPVHYRMTIDVKD